MTSASNRGPAHRWREEVRIMLPGWRDRAGAGWEAAFRAFLLEQHAEARAVMRGRQGDPAAPDDGASAQLFIFAVGAFASGRLDAAEDILDTIPPTANIRHFAIVLPALLPGLTADPRRDPAAVRAWLAAHPALSWDEAAGRFHDG